MGSFELDGSTLRFRQVASTMMACPGDVMPREQAFLKALSATTSFRIRGSALFLRGEDNTVLARLTAQSPKAARP
jgi:heat shock protein HslJ